MQFINDIIDFNIIVLGVQPLPEPKPLAANVAQISIESLVEEMNELKEAYEKDDLVKAIDALCDALYFGVGVLFKMGFDIYQIAAIISGKMPMSKGFGIDVFKYVQESRFSDEHLINPELLYSSELQGFLESFEETMEDLSNAIERNDVTLQAIMVGQLCFGFMQGIISHGVTFDKANEIMAAIHYANMTKKLGVNAKRGDGQTADAVKPADFVPPEQKIAAILSL